MKHLLNTLFVNSEDVYLSLDGENVVASREKVVLARYPLHTLQNIVTFAYPGASPALMGACAERDIGLAFCSVRGRFLARVCGQNIGNVFLRREQYRIADDEARSVAIARNMVFGKLFNCRSSVERTIRDYAMRVDSEALGNTSGILRNQFDCVLGCTDKESLRGFEGAAATAYFGTFDEMILNKCEAFRFTVRSRRPPLDPINALLSFAYTMLSHDCASALESVGLDSYVGFFHSDRPSRASLALDLMEELRPSLADRFVLSYINNRRIKDSDFQYQESGAVLMTNEARKAFLAAWQERKREIITHPYLGEKIEWGMVPYVQSLLLARHIRGDIDEYPPFLWK